jgi:hypothetical protein
VTVAGPVYLYDDEMHAADASLPTDSVGALNIFPNKELDPPQAVTPEALKLHTLAPTFIEDAHRVPLALLLESLDDTPPRTNKARNIALSGPYGSGKSSVLAGVEKKWPERTVNISLSSLTHSENEDDEVDPTSPDFGSTNYIQKEIVKQLLYREAPNDVPDSRYRRIEPTSTDLALFVGLCAAVAAGVTGALTRTPQLIADRLFANNEQAGVIAFLLLILLGGTVAGVVFKRVGRRFDVRSLTAGAATVTLEDRTASYFDKYLDEIVYFFQATRVNIVIFEDLDRFNNPHIYETLRSLNILLNNSKQLMEKIQFVYAVRDSLFDTEALKVLQGRRSDELGDKTKFFELIIPMVPFITHRSAADLLKSELQSVSRPPKDGVLEAIAPHVPDMRLIINIRNEYAVFSRQLLEIENPLGGLNEESLIAMVAYKNLAPTEFERIRTQDSELDLFFSALRDGLNLTIAKDREEKRSVKEALRLSNFTEEVAEGLSVKLRVGFELLHQRAFGIPGELSQVSVADEGEGEASWSTGALISAETWRVLLGARELTGDFRGGRTVSMTRAEFETFVGGDLGLEQFEVQARQQLDSRLGVLQDRSATLRRQSVTELLDQPGVKISYADGYVSARELSERVLKTKYLFILDMLTKGYVTRNYSLYSARYYGLTLSVNAMTFVIECIEPNVADFYYRFDSDVEKNALIEQYGASLFEESAGLNIELVEMLAETDRPEIIVLAKYLGASESSESHRFIASFVEQSPRRLAFFDTLAIYWPGAYEFALGLEDCSFEDYVATVNSALGHFEKYIGVSAPAAPYLERLIDAPLVLSELTSSSSDKRPRTVARQLSSLNVRIADLMKVAKRYRMVLLEEGAWQVTTGNLVLISHSNAVPTLLEVRQEGIGAYETVLDSIPQYLDCVARLGGYVIDDSERFARLAMDVHDRERGSFNAFLNAVKPGVKLTSLSTAPVELWSQFMQHNLVTLSPKEVSAYMEQHGGALDESLAAALEKDIIDSDVPFSLALFSAIVNTQLLSVERKLTLVYAVPSALYPVASLTAGAAGTLSALLGTAITDDFHALARAIELGNEALIEVVKASKHFETNLQGVVWDDSSTIAVLSAEDIGAVKKDNLITWVMSQGKLGPATERYILALASNAANKAPVAIYIYLAENGLDVGGLVSALVANTGRLGYGEIASVLRAMGNIYAELLETGPAIHLPKDDTHEELAQYLVHAAAPVTRVRKAKGWITVYRQ